jgi:hypothetical protein
LEKGKYNGFYGYDDENYREAKKFEKTNFTIMITDTNGQNFYGWVEDDFLSGGMAGRGSIYGKLKGNKISFVKSMPYLGIAEKDKVTGKYKSRMDKTRKHPLIYYSGKKIGKKASIEQYKGRWNFKYGIIMSLRLMVSGIKTGGNWGLIKEPEIIAS